MGIITERRDAMRSDVSGMRTNFDEVATRVAESNSSVQSMSGNIAVIPPMEQRVAGMRQDYDVITAAMGESRRMSSRSTMSSSLWTRIWRG